MSQTITTLAGRPFEYYLELDERLKEKGMHSFTVEELLQDVHYYRGKVSTYEKYIDILIKLKEVR